MKVFIIFVVKASYTLASIIKAGAGQCRECYNSGKTMCLIGDATSTDYDTGMCCSGTIFRLDTQENKECLGTKSYFYCSSKTPTL